MTASPSPPAPITATVTAYRRIEQTLETIRILLACDPPPDELLVHVDAGGNCADAIRAEFPSLHVAESDVPVGPGGGRDRLMRAARNELVANFDDDSYPLDRDFFARAKALFELAPAATIISGKVFHRHEALTTESQSLTRGSSFCGGAVVFRRQHLIEAGGYLPLVVAYGAEEEDISLRLFERKRVILYSSWLRVFHDSVLAHHADPAINALCLANVGLVAFLRYPLLYWPYGLLQFGNRFLWCLRHGRSRGLLAGVLELPSMVWRHRHERHPISLSAMRSRLAVRRTSQDFVLPEQLR